jgi:hypothetical protein
MALKVSPLRELRSLSTTGKDTPDSMSTTDKQRRNNSPALVTRQCAPPGPVSNEHFCTVARHAQERAKTGSEDMLSREHWHAYTSPPSISQETGVPASHMSGLLFGTLMANISCVTRGVLK